MRKIVEVNWVDANGNDGWVSLKRAQTHNLAPTNSIGYIIKKNKRQITIAQSISGDAVDMILSIPASCIKSIKELK